MQFRTLAMATVLAALPTAAAALHPAAVAAEIDKQGAAATVANLVARHRWERVVGLVGTGKPAWLTVAPKLAVGTDASRSLALTIAFANALPRHAAAVIGVAQHATGPLAIERVCAAPFIEPVAADLARYRVTAKHAVEAIKEPALAAARRSCLSALRHHAAAAA